MNDATEFGFALLLVGAAGLAALAAHRLTGIIRIPAPALLLIAAAIGVNVIGPLHAPDPHTVERIVTVALVFILFDGGVHIGWSRLRPAIGPVMSLGLAGTVLSVAGASAFIYLITDFSWYQALLIGTAVAPTDPAVVFSVLGNYQIQGHSGTVLEGESGANDPVGIALMTNLLSAGALTAGAFGIVSRDFVIQLAVGGAVGVAGGLATGLLSRRVQLPSAALYPLRSAACALAIFGVATVAQGSGFLAVFVAGILLGDLPVPRQREIREFHGALAGVGEVVAFVVLGLTIDFDVLRQTEVWVPGLALAAVLTFVVRPGLAGCTLIGSSLGHRERAFVLFAGLKGAVPILLGLLAVAHGIASADRIYGIVVIVVLFSVLVQGSAISWVARLLRIPLQAA